MANTTQPGGRTWTVTLAPSTGPAISLQVRRVDHIRADGQRDVYLSIVPRPHSRRLVRRG